MKELMKVFIDGLAILKEWRTIVLVKGCMWECVGTGLVGRPRKKWIDSVNDSPKKRGMKLAKQEG